MFMFCCWTKDRNVGDDNSPFGNIETRMRNANRILIEFISEEAKIGLREIAYLDLVE